MRPLSLLEKHYIFSHLTTLVGQCLCTTLLFFFPLSTTSLVLGRTWTRLLFSPETY